MDKHLILDKSVEPNSEDGDNKPARSTIFRPANVIIIIIVLLIIGSNVLLQHIVEAFQDAAVNIYHLFFLFVIVAFRIFIIIGLLLKKKIGWILLLFLTILVISISIKEEIMSYLLNNESMINFSSIENLKYLAIKFLIPLLIVVYLNKANVLKHFNISKEVQKKTIRISTIIAVLYICNQLFYFYYFSH